MASEWREHRAVHREVFAQRGLEVARRGRTGTLFGSLENKADYVLAPSFPTAIAMP